MALEENLIAAAHERAKSLLGKRVVVKLDDKTIVKGELLSFSDDGQIVTRDDSGFVTWSWPKLDIEAEEESADPFYTEDIARADYFGQ